MGPAAVTRHFERAPSVLRYYPRALLARRSPVLPEGLTPPRLQGQIRRVRVRPPHLRRYRRVCGFADGAALPITYPHVLAMPLHLALLTDRGFIVRLMGLVHIANRIDWLQPMPAAAEYGVECWLEGHRETDRGQEFDLHTSLDLDGTAVWRECCTLLARRRSSGAAATRSARATLRAPQPDSDAAVEESTFAADHSVGRRYGLVSADLNPIHMADFSARRFGFERAVAHGMWSMARSLAALEACLREPARTVTVDFKSPLYLPGRARLQHWQAGAGERAFVLRAEQTSRPHLAGAILQP